MVIPSDFQEEPPHAKAGHQVESRVHEVIVPVFLKVRVLADDELQAECRAVESVRRLGTYHGDGVTVAMHSVIAPIHSKHQPSCPS